MIDIAKEMKKRVDHPVPYLVDLVGRLVEERDKAIDLAVEQSIRFAGEFDCINLAESEARKWVTKQIDDPMWKSIYAKVVLGHDRHRAKEIRALIEEEADNLLAEAEDAYADAEL